MSWKLGFVLIKTRWEEDEKSLLQKLGFSDVPEPQKVHIADTLELFPTTVSIAVGDDFTMILSGLLPYDLSYEPPFSSPLDKHLKELSKTAPILAGFLDGMTSTYSFCIFEEENVTRARTVVSGRLETDYGKPHAVETWDLEDEEERIFAITASWLGEPLNEFFFDSSFYMNTYDV